MEAEVFNLKNPKTRWALRFIIAAVLILWAACAGSILSEHRRRQQQWQEKKTHIEERLRKLEQSLPKK